MQFSNMSSLSEFISLEASLRGNYFIHGQPIIFVPLHLTLSCLFASHLLEDDRILDAIFEPRHEISNNLTF